METGTLGERSLYQMFPRLAMYSNTNQASGQLRACLGKLSVLQALTKKNNAITQPVLPTPLQG